MRGWHAVVARARRYGESPEPSSASPDLPTCTQPTSHRRRSGPPAPLPQPPETFESSRSAMEHPYGVQPALGVFDEGSDEARSVRSRGLGALAVLPDEAILGVLGELAAADLARLATVSRFLYVFCNHDELWKGLCLEVRGRSTLATCCPASGVPSTSLDSLAACAAYAGRTCLAAEAAAPAALALGIVCRSSRGSGGTATAGRRRT